MTAPTLSTNRLVLRQIREMDAVALYKVLSDERVMTWWSSGAHKTVEETAAYLSWNAAIDQGHFCWAITSENDEALGWVILIEKRAAVYELGYILRRDQWARGFAKEACNVVIEFAFSALKARRLFADTDPDNVGSIALLRSLGFEQEGHLRGEWETHIGVRDSLIFGLLREEWVAGHAEAKAEK
jgi:[ribosomal protein S5]-alanine N-acetyltransferase